MLIMKEMRHACTIRPARKRDLEDFLELEEAIGNPPSVWKSNHESDFSDL